MTVGVDVGTTSVKAVAVDGSGQILARARRPHQVGVPDPGRLEHDASGAWWDGPRQALGAVIDDLARRGPGRPPPVALAVSAMAPSLAAVDRSGHPISAGVLYGDERGRHPLGVERSDPTRSCETMELLRWMASAQPDAAGYWPAQAVANRSLGGPGSVDLGTAVSAGPLFGPGGWDASRCAALSVQPAQLPVVAMFGQAIGEIDVAAPGTLLVAGGVDAFCEQLVAGPLAVGDVLVVAGSTLVVWVISDTDRTVDGLWTLPALASGRSMVGGPSNAGGLFLDWIDRILRPARPGPVAPDSVPVWCPYVRGERVPLHDPELRAAVGGLDLTQGPEQLRRGAYEASAMAVRDIVERAGGRPSRIVVTGGGSRVPPWLQAIADVTAVPVEPVAVAEGAALGAAWLARMGAGLEGSIEDASRWAGPGPVVRPDPAWVGPCEARYGRYRANAEREGDGDPC